MDANKEYQSGDQSKAQVPGRKANGYQNVSRPKLGWPKYAVGIVLIYGICVVLAGSMMASEISSILEVAFILGIVFFIVLGPAHLLFQLLAHWLMLRLWRSNKRFEGLILNLPAAVIFAILLIGVAVPPSPAALRQSLQRHFDGRLPDSVSIKGYRRLRGMDGGSYTFVFSIRSNDLRSLVTTPGFLPSTPSMVSWFQTQAEELTGGTVILNTPCTIYQSKTNHGTSRTERTLVVASNGVDVVFREVFF